MEALLARYTHGFFLKLHFTTAYDSMRHLLSVAPQKVWHHRDETIQEVVEQILLVQKLHALEAGIIFDIYLTLFAFLNPIIIPFGHTRPLVAFSHAGL